MWVLSKVVRAFPLLFPTPPAEDVVDVLLLELYCVWRCVSVYLVNKFANSSRMQMFYISLSNSMHYIITSQVWHHFGCP